MRLIRRVVVGAGAMWLVLLHVSAACGQTSSRTILRTPAEGQLTDGAPLYSTPAGSSESVLLEMAGRAAVIFVGRVTAVRKPADDLLRIGSAGAVVEVDFDVQRSVRGVASGSVYAMREWAGMWRDNPRFLVGQRLLMLLHAPGPGGLSSPVDGLDGAIPIRGEGLSATAALAGESVKPQAGLQADDAVSADQADMRWLQAKTLKISSYTDVLTATPGVASAGAVGGDPVIAIASPPVTASTGSAATGEAAGGNSNSAESATEPLSRLLGLLGSVNALSQGTRIASN